MATADLRLSFGAMFIGCAFSVSFSGMAVLQSFLYFRQYRHKDSKRVRTMVAVLSLLDLVHTIFICQGIWHYLVLSWGNLAELDHLTWTVAASIAITGIMTVIVHLFFAHRVWLLSKGKKPITFLIVVLAIIRLGSAFTTTGQMLRLKSFHAFITEFRWLFTFGLAMTSFIDILITGSLCYFLRSRRTGHSNADDLIHRVTVYTINNGLMSTLASISSMICAAVMPTNFIFLSLHFIIAKCYMNSILATLNTRDSLRGEKEGNKRAVMITVDAPTEPSFRKEGKQSLTPSTPTSPNHYVNATETLDNVKVSYDDPRARATAAARSNSKRDTFDSGTGTGFGSVSYSYSTTGTLTTPHGSPDKDAFDKEAIQSFVIPSLSCTPASPSAMDLESPPYPDTPTVHPHADPLSASIAAHAAEVPLPAGAAMIAAAAARTAQQPPRSDPRGVDAC